MPLQQDIVREVMRFLERRGVVSGLRASTAAAIHGEAILTAGTNITLEQIGQSIVITSTGAGSPSTSIPAAVGAAGSVGTSSGYSRGDHVHAGVISLAASSAAAMQGALSLLSGTNITLTQSTGTLSISIAASAPSASTSSPVDTSTGAVVGTSSGYARGDHAHRGVLSLATSGSTALYGAVTLSQGSNVTLTQTGQDIAIAASGGGGATYVGARVYNSSSQSIATTTQTYLAMDSETHDSDGFHDNATNNSRLTIPAGKAGKYVIYGQTYWMNDSTTGTRVTALMLNRTTRLLETAIIGSAGWHAYSIVSGPIDLAVGDYVELRVYHEAGVNVRVSGGSYLDCGFSIWKVG